MTLEQVTEQLYGLPPEQFTAAREQCVRQARAAGDRELAKQVHALPRPTRTAWLVNQLARGAGDQVEQLLALGQALRSAQDGLAGDELRRLGPQRQRVVYALAREAGRLAGVQVSDAALREVETTLDAALVDPAAGDALRTGRLLRALTRTGLDPVDLDGAVAAPQLAPPPRTAPAYPPGSPAGEAAREARAERHRERERPAQERTEEERADQERAEERAAERERRRRAEERAAAERARTAAQAQLADAEQALGAARDAERQASAQVADLEGRLTEARAAREAAATERRDRRRDRDIAARDAAAAERRLAGLH